MQEKKWIIGKRCLLAKLLRFPKNCVQLLAGRNCLKNSSLTFNICSANTGAKNTWFVSPLQKKNLIPKTNDEYNVILPCTTTCRLSATTTEVPKEPVRRNIYSHIVLLIVERNLKRTPWYGCCPPVGGPNPKPRGKSFFHQKVKEKLRGETRISLEKVRLCLGSHSSHTERKDDDEYVCVSCVYIH